ncbi:hypothetical protein [Microbacterium indicum]|uniref:hypothetical protein n=1 Tax=Microbacterium indicum TaxID=358100 RepID=UPI0003F58667|nr:hypothetical protein [Microbacterium indicum]
MNAPSTAREAFEALQLQEFGPERLALAQRAVRLADEEQDDDLAYRARMHLTAAAHWVDDLETMLPSYGWCVAKHDEDPQRFPIDPGLDGGADLLFQGKWMAGSLSENSGFPLARVDAVVDDLERRFRAAGASMHGLVQVRRDLALEEGDIETAQALTIERDVHPVDDYSHCNACVRASDVELALAAGDDERALQLWGEIHEGGFSCGEEPENVDARILPALVRAGRSDEALATHASSYRLMQRYHAESAMFARHLPFLAQTGNLTRGLDLLEGHISAVGAEPFAEMSTFGVLTSVGILLDALEDAGRGDIVVRGSDDHALARLLGHEGTLTVSDMRDRVWAKAADLAAKFDARSGHDRFAKRLADAQNRAGERVDLPYTAAEFRPAARPAEPEPADAHGWMLRARGFIDDGDLDGALVAVDAGLAFGDVRETPALASLPLYLAIARGDTSAAEAALDRHIAALRAAGFDEKADLEGRVRLALFGGVEITPEVLAALEAERSRVTGDALADVLSTLVDAHRRVEGTQLTDESDAERTIVLAEEGLGILSDEDPHVLFPGLALHLVNALLSMHRYDEALDAADTALGDPRLAGHRTIELRRLKGVALAYLQRFEEAIPLVDGILSDLADTPVRGTYVAEAAIMAARICFDAGRPADAVARYEHAKRLLERAEVDPQPLAWPLAAAQEAAGFAQAALETFEQIYLAEQAAGEEPAGLAVTLGRLGGAARNANEPGLAYRSWSDGFEMALESGSLELARDIGTDLGTLQRDFEDPESVETFQRVLTLVRGFDEEVPWSVINALHNLGSAQLRFGDLEGEKALDEALPLIAEFGEPAQLVDLEITRGMGLAASGDMPRAARVLASAASQAEGVDRDLTAVANLHTASALIELERPADAETYLRTALGSADPGTFVHFHATDRLAAILEARGDASGAAELRASLG